jgi:hypothetical protein
MFRILLQREGNFGENLKSGKLPKTEDKLLGTKQICKNKLKQIIKKHLEKLNPAERGKQEKCVQNS